MILDEEITILHIIICEQCPPEMAVFTDMETWLTHKEIHNHNRSSHTCMIRTENMEVLHVIYPPKDIIYPSQGI